MKPVALTIAGSDPSGGAGLQADLKTFHQFGVYGAAAVTLVTVQNTVSVTQVECLHADLVAAQVRAVLEDIPPQAAKTGALGNAAIVEAVAHLAAGFRFPLVVDPVMISKHGMPLMDEAARETLAVCLLPLATLITPNVPEAEALSGFAIETLEDAQRAAREIRQRTGADVLIKGGHLTGEPVDLLLAGEYFHPFRAARINTPHTHGTGCTYSAAITAELARGTLLVEAVLRAKRYITEAIRTNPGLGHGSGPVNHHADAE